MLQPATSEVRSTERSSHLADVVQAFPGIVLYVAILALVNTPGVTHVIIALCVPSWVLYARIARAEALSLRDAEFVQAAVVLGAKPGRVLGKHVLPNLVGPIVIQATSGVGGVILAESTLSFLGLGPSGGVSWGALLDQGSAVLVALPARGTDRRFGHRLDRVGVQSRGGRSSRSSRPTNCNLSPRQLTGA